MAGDVVSQFDRRRLQMKVTLIVGAVLVALGVGSYAYYTKCHGFNSCINPSCVQDCYEKGVRVR
jgi:hypothetical protein